MVSRLKIAGKTPPKETIENDNLYSSKEKTSFTIFKFSLFNGEKGQTLGEYVLILLLIAIVAIAVLGILGNQLVALYQRVIAGF